MVSSMKFLRPDPDPLVSQRDVMVPGLQRLRDRYEAVLLDLDGTLLNGRSKLTERTRRAVRQLLDHDFLVVLCTGRSVTGTRPTHAALGLDTEVVTYNGSWIGHPDGEPDHYIPIPDGRLADLFQQEKGAAFAFRHHREEKHTVMTDHPDHDPVAAWFQNVIRAPHPDHLPAKDLLRVSMFFCATTLPEDDIAAALLTRLPAHARPDLRIECFPLNVFPIYAASTLHLFEAQGASAGKAEAFAWLQAKHGIPSDRVIAVGDHHNDLSMLEGAGLALTPENGVPAARDRAHLVVGHHDEDGLAAWIEAGAPTHAARPRRVELPA